MDKGIAALHSMRLKNRSIKHEVVRHSEKVWGIDIYDQRIGIDPGVLIGFTDMRELSAFVRGWDAAHGQPYERIERDFNVRNGVPNDPARFDVFLKRAADNLDGWLDKSGRS